MLTETELTQYFDHLQIPDDGRARIRAIRNSLPSRAVKTNKVSGKTRYAPLKMPWVIEVEATSTEYVLAVEMDHDNETIEFYPQPLPLKISYLTTNKVRRTTIHSTPDFLRVGKSAVTFIECKTEDELERLARQMPGRYQRDSQGTWHSPPAEEAAAQFGCKFEIRSSRQNNWLLFENLEMLKDYSLGIPATAPDEAQDSLLERLKTQGWFSLYELIHMQPSVPADAIFAAIAQRRVYFPITQMRLSDPEHAMVFRDETTYRAHSLFLKQAQPTGVAQALGLTLEPGQRFEWDSNTWEVINPGKEAITIQRLATQDAAARLAELTPTEFGQLVQGGRIGLYAQNTQGSSSVAAEMLRRASPKQMKEALDWLAVIEGHDDPKTNPFSGRKKRARQYMKSRYRKAMEQHGNGFVGLLINRGKNRKHKASEEALKLAEEVIATDWETIRHKHRSASHGRYSDQAELDGLTPISYSWFCKLVKGRSGHLQDVSRIGEKAAYDTEPQYLELEWTTPTHGTRPWHIAHIDHTPLPLQFVDSQLGLTVSTIWLSVLIDAYSRKILAYYLSFDKPSHRSCMMVIRDCVRRHNRVPQILVCDQGSDFRSVYFEALMASLRITKRERRSGKPRAGSVVERVFNTTQSQFVKNLLGATDLVEKYFRSISPEVDPTRHAVWTLDKFDLGFQRYLDEVYHRNHHSGIGMAPDAAYAYGLKTFGERSHLLIPYSDNFIVQSCPAAHRGTAKITPAGIKINYRWFKCSEFQMPGVLGKVIPARFDPFNAGKAYAFLNGRWHVCLSELYAIFNSYTHRAVWLATARAKLIAQISGKQLTLNAERIAGFLREQEDDELLSRQLLHDRESQGHRLRIESPNATAQLLATDAANGTSPTAPANPPITSSRREPRPVRQLEDL